MIPGIQIHNRGIKNGAREAKSVIGVAKMEARDASKNEFKTFFHIRRPPYGSSKTREGAQNAARKVIVIGDRYR